ncbi:nitroreductase family protein [Thalassotalea euphylliae]|nr:nitroreductase family protein [Thalassotalea euphylliae]
MQPRREVFAEAYIGETIDCFQNCLQSTEMCKDELKWAQDVLVKYFEVVGSSSVLDRARSQFEQLTLMSFDLDADSLPYQHNQRVKSPITQQQLESLFKQRRSVRWYENKPVELDKLQQAIEMASQAPSACNRQPFQFYTTVDQSKAAELSSIAMGTTGFADNIPALIVVVGDLSSYPAERDRHVIYIDGGLASMQLMLALETIGLSSCPINWPDIEVCEVKLAKKLNLPAHLRPIMMIAIGYAQSEGQIPYSQKKSAQLLLKEIH